MTYELSVLIPARNEMFLRETIEDALKHKEADTEIIVALDGAWPESPLPRYDHVQVIYSPRVIGMRAVTNLACSLSTAKYVMKVDAHCGFDQGFDRKMIEGFEKVGDNVTMVPVMRNLWAYSWKCYHCGWKKYQGPTPKTCEQCKKSDRIRRKILWLGKRNPQSTSYCFDASPHFQYFEAYKHREPYITDKRETGMTETMSLQGSCFMAPRNKYWELELCDERAGSWGNQGMEVALATWLTGGRVLVNHNTWYAHMFRTQGGDFGFPYNLRGREVQQTKNYIVDKFWNFKHPKQIQSVKWLIEKFAPVPGWTDQDIDKLK